MTRDGLIQDENPPPKFGGNDFNQEYKACEWVFRCKGESPDYHHNMEGGNYIRWVRKQLIPSVKSGIRGKKAFTLLDNASYHHADDEETRNPLRANVSKKKVVQWVMDEFPGFKSLTCSYERKGKTIEKTFERSDFKKRFPKGPPAGILKEKFADYLRATHPDVLYGVVERTLREANIIPIWTPPYMAQFAAIEHLWRDSKNAVARDCYEGRTLERTYESIFRAWRGGPAFRDGHKKYPGIKSKQTNGYVRQAIKEINAYVENDSVRLNGKVDGKLTIEPVSVYDEISDDITYFDGYVPPSDVDTNDVNNKDEESEKESDFDIWMYMKYLSFPFYCVK